MTRALHAAATRAFIALLLASTAACGGRTGVDVGDMALWLDAGRPSDAGPSTLIDAESRDGDLATRDLGASPSCAAGGTVVFAAGSSPSSFVVPGDCTAVTISAWGAGGGGGGDYVEPPDDDHHIRGGGGAFVRATVATTGGETLEIRVATAGTGGTYDHGYYAGGGGGASIVARGTELLVVAAGGGGGASGAGGTPVMVGSGGAGGGTTGQFGGTGRECDFSEPRVHGEGGGGGGPSEGGRGGFGPGTGEPGRALAGGSSGGWDGAGLVLGGDHEVGGVSRAGNGGGGAGGAGWFGGGGGAYQTGQCGGGGGGGSSHAAVVGAELVGGDRDVPGGQTESGWEAGVGEGGAQGAPGGDGRIVITFGR